MSMESEILEKQGLQETLLQLAINSQSLPQHRSPKNSALARRGEEVRQLLIQPPWAEIGVEGIY